MADKNNVGSFTISLDLELFWGVRDKREFESYKENLLGVWIAIPEILNLFKKYNIHATWASVGFLFYANLDNLLDNLPERYPDYQNKNLNQYDYIHRIEVHKDKMQLTKTHFCKELIKEINKTSHQEIGTHTFSHLYTNESGITSEDFIIDIKKALEVSSLNNIEINSIVFPRNQINYSFLKILQDFNIYCFRGNPSHWAYRDGEINKTFFKRLYRLFDTYINLSGHNTVLPNNTLGLCELKYSMFLRSYNKKLKLFEFLKLRRIKRAMTYAAKNNENFHLWWHPHNFGKDIEFNIKNLNEILKHYKFLSEKYNMVSLNMSELYNKFKEGTNE
jgi:peptidoglycan/xylan/chitin deacetylase (PgdA/CDA1 family)